LIPYIPIGITVEALLWGLPASHEVIGIVREGGITIMKCVTEKYALFQAKVPASNTSCLVFDPLKVVGFVEGISRGYFYIQQVVVSP
jgi:hypothetical protein